MTTTAQALLDRLTLDDLFDPAIWPRLGFFAQFVPDGDVLPIRTKRVPGDARQIGINPLFATDPLWYAGPDIAASILLSGKIPKLKRAFAVEPIRGGDGKPAPIDGLRSVKLLDSLPIDPKRENFFLKTIEERQRAKNNRDLSDAERSRFDKGLKVIANASSYGILAQMDPVDLLKDESKAVHVFGALGDFQTRTAKPERPGEFFFPPIAALITAGARCMLAMLERSVSDLGGTYAMEDTDSMAIVATPDGGLVPCPGGPYPWTRGIARAYTGPNARESRDAIRSLSFAQADAIAAKFSMLNPYDRSVVPGSILKVEDVNHDADGQSRQLWCYAISSKRYALFTLDDRGGPHVARDSKNDAQCSEHGLGHLLNPIDAERDGGLWIVQSWETIAREHLGLPVMDRDWLDRPALTRLAVSTPYLWKPFRLADKRKPYADQIKPFNFLPAAHVVPMGFPVDADPARFLLVAPYESDPAKWRKLRWTDVHRSQEHAITTDADHRLYHPEKVLVMTYRDALLAFRMHPEAKSLRPDGLPCDEAHKACAGLLSRRPAVVGPHEIEHIGKEMNELDSVLADVAHDEDQIVTRYVDVNSVPFDRLRVLLRCIPMPEFIRRTEGRLSQGTIERARRGPRIPHPASQELLRQAVLSFAFDGGTFSFEAIERLDPVAIEAEIEERFRQRPSTARSPERARADLAHEYTNSMRAGLGLLGLQA